MLQTSINSTFDLVNANYEQSLRQYGIIYPFFRTYERKRSAVAGIWWGSPQAYGFVQYHVVRSFVLTLSY